MKRKYFAFLTAAVLMISLCGCGGQGDSATDASGKDAEEFTIRELSVWYLASDETDDYTGEIRLYDFDDYSLLAQWLEDNTGKLFESAEETEDGVYTITVNASQKEKLQQIVDKKYAQALKEIPEVCDLIVSASASEEDDHEFDICYSPDVWLDTDMSSLSGLGSLQNPVILGNFWQFKEELENGADFIGTAVWKNADTEYQLMSLDLDPAIVSTFDGSKMAVRHTNYADYDGTLDFNAEYIGTFTDDEYDGTFYEFEVLDDRCYEKGEKICFYTEELPCQPNEGDEVVVTFSGDDLPDDYVFTSHDQEACFTDENVYEMSLTE